MQKALRTIWNACYFLLCFAQIPLIAGHFLMGDSLPALIMLAALLPLSFLISLVPGRIGGKKKSDEATVVRRTSGGDPDPDRALRNEALPLPEKKAFPLRAAVCFAASFGVAAAIFFAPVFTEIWWIRRLILAAVMAFMLPLALRTAALRLGGRGSVLAGIVAYAVAGIAAYVEKSPVLDQRLMICGILFILITAFSVNNESMARSAAYREGVKPPANMRRRNRILLSGIIAVGAVVLYFDKIREKAIDAAQWVLWAIGKVLSWLNNLIPRPEDAGGGGMGGGQMDMSEFGAGETGAFWAATEKIIMWVGMAVCAVLVLWWLRKVGKLLMVLIKRMMANLKKLTDTVSEEYEDEHESLFDWDETRKEMGEGLRKRLERLMRREKKWDQMDVRERVRFIVRTLYRKTPNSAGLRSLTVHEALGSIRTGQAQPDELAQVYDTARYGQTEPDAQVVERLRKEAKV